MRPAPALVLLLVALACGGTTGADGASGPRGPNITVQLLGVSNGRRTHGNPLIVDAIVDGAAPNSVEIWIDQVRVLQQLANEDPAATHQILSFAWSASAADQDGPHTIFARAVFAGIQVDSAEQAFVLDRVAPRVTSVDPPADGGSVCPGDVFTLQFDEPMAQWPDSGVGGGEVLRFSLDDGGVLPSFPVLDRDAGTTITTQTEPLPDAGPPSGGLTLDVLPQLTDLAGNSVEPFETSWPLGADCPPAGP